MDKLISIRTECYSGLVHECSPQTSAEFIQFSGANRGNSNMILISEQILLLSSELQLPWDPGDDVNVGFNMALLNQPKA